MTVAASRILGVAVICISFYFAHKWVYFFAIMIGLTILFLGLFTRYCFESPHFFLSSTASVDGVKYLLNKIALVNDEDLLTEKIGFSQTPTQVKKRRSMVFLLKNLANSRAKLLTLSVFTVTWLAFMSTQMMQYVFFGELEGDVYLNIIIVTCTEFMASLFSRVILKVFTRRVTLLICNCVIMLGLFFLLILGSRLQVQYVVTITIRAGLQILSNCLMVATLEQFPTESRAFSWYFCFAFGLVGGIGLPFIDSLNSVLILIVLLLFVKSSIGIFFIRETKRE